MACCAARTRVDARPPLPPLAAAPGSAQSRAPQKPPPTKHDQALASLRQKLGGQKMSKLRRRAADNVGVTEEQLDQIDDAHEPREALIELVLGHQRQQLEEAENEEAAAAAAAVGPTTEDSLRQELGAMKVSELRRRAISDRINAAAVEVAGDEDDAKAALIRLICAAAARSSSQKGDGGAAAEAKVVLAAEAAEVLHRAELAGLKMSTLRKRVKEAGAGQQAIEEADDADDARAAMIELLLASQSGQTDRPDSALEALRQELISLKLGALRKRARAAGVDHDTIDEIDEDEDPKAALVELIVTATSNVDAGPAVTPAVTPAGGGTPRMSLQAAHTKSVDLAPAPKQSTNTTAVRSHHGNSVSRGPGHASSLAPVYEMNGRHVMLSCECATAFLISLPFAAFTRC